MQITDAQIRTWLGRLAKGGIVYDPELVAVMRAHEYSATGKTRAEVAADATQFLRDKIETLRAPRGASTREQMPHAVLMVCFVEGWTADHAATRLHVSPRQMSRERTRAIGLLRDALTTFPADAPTAETEPTTWAELVAQLNRIETTVT